MGEKVRGVNLNTEPELFELNQAGRMSHFGKPVMRNLGYKERTVRDYVYKLRNEHNLPKTERKREYSSVPELPPGQQLQADFGQYWAERQDARRIKLHFVIFILAHSRYKYIVWQTRSFTSVDFVRSLESCFESLGGIPRELVIDQDRLMTVDENYGDIIYTHEFERCKNRHGFTV
ncbi:MAG: hypothetical protein ACYC1M_19520, partial [Armatimonadota bacterium]